MVDKEVLSNWIHESETIIEFYEKHINQIHVNRVNVHLFDGCLIKIGEQKQMIKQIANVHIIDNSTLEIKPWQKGILKEIESSLNFLKKESGLHFAITSSKDSVICKFDMVLTREKKLEICKILKKKTEDSKLAIKNLRQDHMKQIKAQKLPEDDQKKYEKELQRIIDNAIKKIDDLSSIKEQSIMNF